MYPEGRLLRHVIAGRTLGQLVFVVREAQVDTTGVNVEGQSQQLVRHGRAFDVPARTSG